MFKVPPFLSLLTGIVVCLLLACERDPIMNPVTPIDPPGGDSTNVPLKPKFFDENTWIYQQMTMNYLWADEMPDEQSTDKNLAPIDYFYTLLSKQKDIFSYAKEDFRDIEEYWGGNLESYGFRYKKLVDSTIFKAVVSLVLKGSPAERAGVKRGDWLYEVDGERVSRENVVGLLERRSANFVLITPEDSVKTVHLSKEKFQMDPLQFYTLLHVGKKKVGYLVYTQFLFGTEDEVRRIFQHFKEHQIDEMIIDLRFNPGGVTPVAEIIASLLGPDVGASTELYHGIANRYENEQALLAGSVLDTRRNFTPETANLSHLSRLFVLTSRSSASSSELVINCLRPYREVITVGGNTYGKNVISTILKNEKFGLGIMPAWRSILNVNNESAYGLTGIPADYAVEENFLPYRPLGDTTETLLAAALRIIRGNQVGVDTAQVRQVQAEDGFHHYDSGTGFLGNKRYHP